MLRSVALALITVVSAGPAPAGARAGSLVALVAAGERSWTTSPDPQDPLACGTCHYDADATRVWAASFPKCRPLPPPAGRVMTLLQANAEAVQRHYGLTDPEQVALAITAYLTSRGTGVPISPGIVAGQPVFEARQPPPPDSAAGGRGSYASRCPTCNDPGAAPPPPLPSPPPGNGRAEAPDPS